MSTHGRKTEECRTTGAGSAAGASGSATATASIEGAVTLPYVSDETTESAKRGPDVSGRDRMAWNVFTSWAGYIVFIVAGFVLPRFIDRHVSQAGLGVWDFAWSVISYFGLAQVGMGSTVNRYVAQYRSERDMARLNAAVSSVAYVLLGVGLFVAVLSIGAAYAVPWMLKKELADFVSDARWVVLLLGLSLAFQQATDVYNGILTGCHRWDLHNAIHCGVYAVQAVAQIVALVLGGGLKAMAVVTLAGMVVSQTARIIACRRVCPELEIAWRHVSLSATRQQVMFGGKTFVPRLAEIVMDQATSLLIVPSLGPAALAIFSRPKGLIRHVSTLVGKFSYILTPTAGSLHATGDRKELARMLTRTTRFGAYMALPMVLMLVVLGGPILTVWMGAAYARHGEGGLICAVMALGNLMTIAQLPVISILQGMNAHGRPGLAKLVASVGCLALAWVTMFKFDMGLLGAAISVTVPLALSDGLYVPWHACRELGLSFGRYLFDVWRGPIVAALPFVGVLLLGRYGWMTQVNIYTLAETALAAGAVLAATYWVWVLPPSAKERAWAILARLRGRMARSGR